MNRPRLAVHHQISSPVSLRHRISQSAAVRTKRQRVVNYPFNRNFRLAVLDQKPLLGSATGVNESLSIRAKHKTNSQGVESVSLLPVDDIEPIVSRA
jgi:hypothetical protein